MIRTPGYAEIIEEYMLGMKYPAQPALLYDPIRYALGEGGKRLRSMLAVMTCGLWRDDVSEVLPAAAAIEMFHNFTLLHDDIMDNASLRRGRASVYNKWSANVAILSGDSLMICSYKELSKTRPDLLPAVMEYFNEAAVRVCEGQQYDMDFEVRDDVAPAEHVAMIELKTSALFVGAVSIGAAIGGAREADIEHLRNFAMEFGIAFQMQDDLLDSYGDTRFGKNVGGDILEGKKSFLKMRALSVVGDMELAELNTLHDEPSIAREDKISRVIAIYDRYGVKQAIEREITERFEVAAASLDRLSAEEVRIEEFKQFALSLLGRDK